MFFMFLKISLFYQLMKKKSNVCRHVLHVGAILTLFIGFGYFGAIWTVFKRLRKCLEIQYGGSKMAFNVILRHMKS